MIAPWDRGSRRPLITRALAKNPVDECVDNIPTAVERTVAGFIEVHGAMNP